jgi:hypothetical protein
LSHIFKLMLKSGRVVMMFVVYICCVCHFYFGF